MTTTTASGSDSDSPVAGDPVVDDAGADSAIEVVDRAPVAAPGPHRAGMVCGIVVFVYALFLAVEVIVAGFDHRLYNRLHEIQGNAFARLALGVVVLCAIFHGLNGLRLIVADVPLVARHQASGRSVVAFATFALGVPAATVILWPSISELFR